VEEAAGRTRHPADWLGVVAAAGLVRAAVEAPARSVKETWEEAEPREEARVVEVEAADRQAPPLPIPTPEEVAAAARRFQSPAKASCMRLEEEALLLALRALAGHLELAAGAENGAAQRQRLVPRTLVAVVAVRMSMRTETLTMRLAQDQAALW